jgi:ribosomal protein S18 acetylase RimI-like enzyme
VSAIEIRHAKPSDYGRVIGRINVWWGGREIYIHFVGVTPEDRGAGLGRKLYERFFEEARANGRTVVRCVTSPLNEGSLAFHQALGFEVERVAEDYDGPGEDRTLLVKRLS